MDDRPSWARRIRAEREARQWSQSDAVTALRAHGPRELPGRDSLLRSWKRWEAGVTCPDVFYQRLLAQTFGTVTAALFPIAQPNREPELSASSGMTTQEIIDRLHPTDLDNAALEGLQITVERLCSEYSYMPADQLLLEGRQWLHRLTGLLDRRLTLAQHQEVLNLAGWIALLVGCVENDAGDPRAAEETRRAALTIGHEAGNSHIVGWAWEMRCWFALTEGDYRSVVQAAEGGQHVAGEAGVSVQLAAQAAKAWARMGDRRQVELALDHGRQLLERLPVAGNLGNHFTVDPGKYDYYAMDCYKLLGEDRLAETYAHEVLRTGSERSPMRNAEANIALGVVAARRHDIEQAVHHGRIAFEGGRQSLPSLLMCSRELAAILQANSPSEPHVQAYVHQLQQVAELPSNIDRT